MKNRKDLDIKGLITTLKIQAVVFTGFGDRSDHFRPVSQKKS